MVVLQNNNIVCTHTYIFTNYGSATEKQYCLYTHISSQTMVVLQNSNNVCTHIYLLQTMVVLQNSNIVCTHTYLHKLW